PLQKAPLLRCFFAHKDIIEQPTHVGVGPEKKNISGGDIFNDGRSSLLSQESINDHSEKLRTSDRYEPKAM
ncbi:MAG: hypothetical protein IJ677_08800, partial [Alphaproteobacteria bacterium]|nr:hypothetical protein [Alphaproteobacteria bacterium]